MNNQDNQDNPLYDVGSSQELIDKYGLTPDNRRIIKLDPSNVPPALHGLIPYAQKWGEGDDIIRDTMVYQADLQSLRDMIEVFEQYDYQVISHWLSGPESYNPSEMTAEYLAFCALDEAYAVAKARLRKHEKD